MVCGVREGLNQAGAYDPVGADHQITCREGYRGGGAGPQALGGGIESRGNLMTSGRSVGQPEELSAPGGFIYSSWNQRRLGSYDSGNNLFKS